MKRVSIVLIAVVTASSPAFAKATRFECALSMDRDPPTGRDTGGAELPLPAHWNVAVTVPVDAANLEDLPTRTSAQLVDGFAHHEARLDLIGPAPGFVFLSEKREGDVVLTGMYNLTAWDRPRNDVLLVKYLRAVVGKAAYQVGYGRGPCRVAKIVEDRK